MEINKKDLKKISKSFRTYASRAINSYFEEFDNTLRMFINYIDDTAIINEYINNLNVPEINVEQEFNRIQKGFSREVLNTGSSVEEETVYIYKFLKYLVDNNISVFTICSAYSFSHKYNDMVSDFGKRVVLPFVNNIENYLTDISIDMGFDENEKYIITVHGGQVNIARGKSTINATQHNSSINIEELERLVEVIKQLTNAVLSSEDKETITDCTEVIEEELKKDNPKKGIIRTAITGLKGIFPKISDSIELTAAITNIIEFAKNVL